MNFRIEPVAMYADLHTDIVAIIGPRPLSIDGNGVIEIEGTLTRAQLDQLKAVLTPKLRALPTRLQDL